MKKQKILSLKYGWQMNNNSCPSSGIVAIWQQIVLNSLSNECVQCKRVKSPKRNSLKFIVSNYIKDLKYNVLDIYR